MQINNLYLAEIVIIDKDYLVSTQYRLVWARSETDAMCEVYDLYSDDKLKPQESHIDVTVAPAIGKMVR